MKRGTLEVGGPLFKREIATVLTMAEDTGASN
jgi:hypothetical protein